MEQRTIAALGRSSELELTVAQTARCIANGYPENQLILWPWRRFSGPFLGRNRSPPLATPTPCQRTAQFRSLAGTESPVWPSPQIPDFPPPGLPSNTAPVSFRLVRFFRSGSRSDFSSLLPRCLHAAASTIDPRQPSRYRRRLPMEYSPVHSQ